MPSISLFPFPPTGAVARNHGPGPTRQSREYPVPSAPSLESSVAAAVAAALVPLVEALVRALHGVRAPEPHAPTLHSDSEGDASKKAAPPRNDDGDDDYDADLEAFEAQLVLLSPSPSEHALLHIIEEESTHRAAVQADCVAFLRGVGGKARAWLPTTFDPFGTP